MRGFCVERRVTGMERYYQYAGRTLCSDFAFPELAEVEATRNAALVVTLVDALPPPASLEWTHDFPDPLGRATLTCQRTSRDYRLHFPHVATVVASPDGALSIHPHDGAGMESVRHVLLDQALPRVIAQHGELVLHAALVGTLSGKSLLLIGDSGRGKSTLTGAFFASGRAVGTDDGAVVSVHDGVVVATPTYPSLRLLPDSRAHLFAGAEANTLPVADYMDKRRLPVPGAIGTTRVDAIVLLDLPLQDGATPRLSRETPGLACMAMIRHGFQLDLSDTPNLKLLLAKAAEAAGLTPVYRLEYPRRYEALADVIALLEAEA